MTHNNQSVSPLRQRMLEDMCLRKLSPKTQTGYVRAVKNFTHFFGRSPDTADAEDLRRFQLHLASSDISHTTINAMLIGLRFFFEITLERLEAMKRMSRVYLERKLPVILSVEEVARLLDNAPSIKYQAALSVAYGAGLRACEVAVVKVTDVDSERMVLRVEQGKAAGTAMPCCRRSCSCCCAPGGATPTRRERCCPVAGCSRDRARSIRSRRASSTALVMRPSNAPESTSACPCTRFATIYPS